MILHKPMEKVVSFETGAGFETINVLYCDCGATCPPPPEQLSVEPNGDYLFSWDLMAEECITEGTSMRTNKSRVGAGSYLVTLRYSLPSTRERIPLEIPFKLD